MKAAAILAVSLLAGWLLSTPEHAASQASTEDPSVKCFEGLESDEKLRILIPKIGSITRSGQASVEMRASKETATEDEKKALSAWGAMRKACHELGRDYRARNAPPGIVDADEWMQGSLIEAIANLARGTMTYGQFIAERERIGTAGMARIRAPANLDSAARAQQAQQDKDRTNALMQSLLRGSQIPPAGPGTTCFKEREWISGFGRTCVYRCLGSEEAAQTVGTTELCPISIQR